ncbi:hypothetical protein YC2023_118149 [Brassica napus]
MVVNINNECHKDSYTCRLPIHVVQVRRILRSIDRFQFSGGRGVIPAYENFMHYFQAIDWKVMSLFSYCDPFRISRIALSHGRLQTIIWTSQGPWLESTPSIGSKGLQGSLSSYTR